MTAALKYLNQKYLSQVTDALFERQMQRAALRIFGGPHFFPHREA